MKTSVLNYTLKGTLGEGGFGKVKLAEDPDTGQHIAIKIIPRSILELKLTSSSSSSSSSSSLKEGLENDNASSKLSPSSTKAKVKGLVTDHTSDPPKLKCSLPFALEKEVAIHKAIQHPNIIRLFEYCGNAQYIFLLMEWASGGELFDKIIPDVGLPEDVTHYFFRQLASAVDYLHKKGIAHRDLKPENILLDDNGNLKLTDFGFATIFKYKGKRRKLNSICGSPVYLAPEVLEGSYDGDLADLWSMGIILFVMYQGIPPWSEPTRECYDFGDYLFARFDGGPLPPLWQSLPPKLRRLLFGLVSVPTLRYSMCDLAKDPWILQPNTLLGPDGLCTNVLVLAQKMCNPKGMDTIMSTQPEMQSSRIMAHSAEDVTEISSFSQPEHIQHDDGQEKSTSLSSFLSGYPLTRFFTMTPPEDFSILLSQRFTDLRIHYTVQTCSPPSKNFHFHFHLVDSKRCPIHGHVCIQPVTKYVWIVMFLRKKGDPLEFKKVFQKTLEGCTWNVLSQYNTIDD